MDSRLTRRRLGVFLFVTLAAVLVAATATAPGGSAPPGRGGFQDEEATSKDKDLRSGKKAPSGRQLGLVKEGTVARWNAFGTPETLIDYGGYLATGLPEDGERAARAYLRTNSELLGLSRAAIDELELVFSAPLESGNAVLLRQEFGGLDAGHDGLVSVGVVDGKVTFLSSSLSRDTSLAAPATLTAAAAAKSAAADIGHATEVTGVRAERGWTVVDLAGFTHPARVRLVALPTPEDGVRAAYETVLVDNGAEPVGVTSWVDGRSGVVLVRESIVDYASDNPAWKAFTASPPLDYSSADTREIWCWTAAASCDRVVGNPSSPLEWDRIGPAGPSTLTTNGNNAFAVHNWFSNNPFSVGTEFATPSPTRDYTYSWTNQWYGERCNPGTTFTSAERNDIDAARANLFAMHNRMHDWSYVLGFTEATFNLQRHNYVASGVGNDPERGNAQAGGVSGGPPGFAARDNANQITPADGVAPITNMYLWQPIAGAFYAPCVDGDFDMSVIGHEYTHAISNRMVAGPSAGLSGAQAGALGESWSDLAAMEYLVSNGLVPVGGENPYAVGPYVTGDDNAGIRNYGMNDSPLNYSNVGYDLTGPQVHADGEIWSATNFDIREALIAKYGAGTLAQQQSCITGATPVGSCPGNRRWIQLVFDAWLLMAAGNVSMVDARDAMLAADVTRFGGANQAELWNAFAKRGLGQAEASNGNNDPDPLPDFTSPYADEATVTLVPGAEAAGASIQLYVGDYEARSRPIADTDPATTLDATFEIVPGEYDFVARGNGFGAKRFTFAFNPGQVRDLPVPLFRNVASAANGATASGDGTNLGALIDDTESTNWTSLDAPAIGDEVTVRLQPDKAAHQIRRVQVSALLRPVTGPSDPAQNRFTALRQFEIWTCEAGRGVDCSQDSQFTRIFTSPADAFPSIAPRPRAPQLIYRSYEVPQTRATHVRLVVVHNQCTGAPDYQGDQDNDPGNVTDCSAGSVHDEHVRASELQVFEH